MYSLLCLLLTTTPYLYSFHDQFITNPQQSDGFGSQYQTLISAVIYAELVKKTFLYTPFKTMEHNYTHDVDFIQKKEQLINFLENFPTIQHLEGKPYTANSTIPFKRFFDQNVVACSQSLSLKKIKQLFRTNKHRERYFDDNHLHIAIHIRRPNSHDNRIEGTNLPDSYFLTIIHKLRSVYSANNPLVHLYSQGNIQQFKVFESPDIIFHLNESIEDTFTAMVLADVLVTGASSFSYTAGLLSNGTVYYTPFWHNPLPHWISVNTFLSA